MNETEVLNILTDWNFWGNFKENPRMRSTYLDRMNKLFAERTATVVLGVRRAGKSSMTYLFLIELINKQQLLPKDSLIVNMEDPRFPLSFNSSDLFYLYEVYLKNLQPDQPVIILDEIQNIDGWEKFVRYLVEAQKRRVIVTGSSSKLLGLEISTVLIGRHVDIEVLPLSFKEFLAFRNLKPDNKIDLIRQRIEVKHQLDEYLMWGGFPEVVLADNVPRKTELLIRYFDDILIKDVARRYGVKEINKLENQANILISNISAFQSFNKLKSRVGASLDTVERFANYFEIARMFFFIKKFNYSVGEQVRSINKIYVIDPGFYVVKGFKFSVNAGRIAENAVAIELWRQRAFNPQLEIYYWKDYQQKEVDFVVKEGQRIRQLIQVCWDVGNEQTRKREIQNLIKASAELGCDDLLVITEDYEAEEKLSWMNIEKSIRFVPLWLWLLE